MIYVFNVKLVKELPNHHGTDGFGSTEVINLFIYIKLIN